MAVQIFISYARDDDIVPPGSTDGKGFVTSLHEDLERVFTLQGPERPHIWRDQRRIAPADLFEPMIKDAIVDSQILLVVLSRNWMERPFCLLELRSFGDRWKGEGVLGIKRRIVIAAKHHADPDRRPSLLQGQEGFQFFLLEQGEEQEFFPPGSEEERSRYRASVTKLGKYLWKLASRMERPKASGQPRRTIYLAKPAKDMRVAYDRLVEELQGGGYEVVPSPFEDIPRDSDAAAFIERSLARAELSIHLLGNMPGFTPDGAPHPIVQLQLAFAAKRAAGERAPQGSIPFQRLIWAPKLLTVAAPSDDVDDEQDSSLNENERDAGERRPLDVLAKFGERLTAAEKVESRSLSEFADVVRQQLDRTVPITSEPAGDSRNDPRVYLFHRIEDSKYVAEIAKVFWQLQVKPVVPALGGGLGEVSVEDLRKLAECDAVVVCWAAASEVWARANGEKLKDWRQFGRSSRFVCRGLLAGPPPDLRKGVCIELAEMLKADDEFDQVLDLTQYDHPPREKLEELARLIRRPAP